GRRHRRRGAAVVRIQPPRLHGGRPAMHVRRPMTMNMRNAGRALLVAGAVALAAGACTKGKESLVVVSLTASPAEAGVTSVRITIKATDKTFTLADGGGIAADTTSAVKLG